MTAAGTGASGSASANDAKIAFIGGGNMAHALATRLATSWAGPVVVAEPIAEQRARFAQPIATTADNRHAVADAGVVVLAVKPQVVETVAREIAPALGAALVVSIAAGVPLAAVERWLGGARGVVRCMPNTPALLGAGISGLVANAVATPAERQLAEAVLKAAGGVLWFQSDADLDAVTALSGSGPAYFFYMIEALQAAGRDLGLEADASRRLAVATAAGAAAMAAEDDAAELRQRVTSPGGTTERALSILAERSFPAALAAAVRGAYERSRELAQELGGHE